jgi:hypothetical protein
LRRVALGLQALRALGRARHALFYSLCERVERTPRALDTRRGGP